jgi:type IV pilus assembly protein PilA
MVFIMRFDEGKTMRVPGPQPITIPAFSFLLRVDGVGGAIEDTLRGVPLFKASEVGGMHLYEFNQPLPVQGLKPVIAIEGQTLFFATTQDFLDECRAQKSTLANDAQFKKGLAELGTEGNGIGFVSPRVFKHLGEIGTLNPNLPPQAKTVFESLATKMPKVDRPLMTVRVNLPDGILVRSSMNRSLKQEVALVSVYNPVTIGLIAAMAVPAFQKVRMASGETAVRNNLRQLSAAADQFYMEKGVTRAQYDDLVGPDKYIKSLVPVMGENYRVLRFRSGEPLRIRLPDGRMIEAP